MNQKPPLYLIATLIVGGGLNILAQALGSALPKYATLILNITGIVVAIAGLIVTYYQAVNAPATSLAVSSSTGSVPVITPEGQPNATVVTTTSTEPTTAPLASAAQVPPTKGP
jgi:hypothetical protein